MLGFKDFYRNIFAKASSYMSFCYLMSKIVKQNLSGINPVPIPWLFVSQRDFICWYFLLCAEGYNGLQNSQFLDLFPRFFLNL